jgi:isopenicillin N synthase-like dioxygenase
MSLDYTQIPVLDWTLVKRDPPAFVSQLRNAMINVGFLYLSNHSVPMDLVNHVIDLTPKFFTLPQKVKNSVDMSQSPHFHGYLRVGGEARDGNPDTREANNIWHVQFINSIIQASSSTSVATESVATRKDSPSISNSTEPHS